MFLKRLQQWFGSSAPARRRRQPEEFHLDIEPLEDRLAPQFSVSDLNQQNLTDVVNQLVGTGITAFNIQSQNVPESVGTFSDASGGQIMGCADGVVLSSGHADVIIGPNSGTTTFVNNLPGDASLQTLVTGATLDATTLQFDFVPKGNVITFKFAFGSEEYNTFVNTQFNDVFGFFLNGKNLALIPGTSTPVTINTVNGGNPIGTGATNPQFFRNNLPTPGTIDTGLNGLTTLFTVVAAVKPNELNTIKFAIADVADRLLDSDVMMCDLNAIKISTYCPFRYRCDGQGNFIGDMTVVNNSKIDLPAPLFLIFNSLPPGVRLLNANGVTPSGFPFFNLPASGLPGETAIKIPIVLSNPNNVPLDTMLNCQQQINSILL